MTLEEVETTRGESTSGQRSRGGVGWGMHSRVYMPRGGDKAGLRLSPAPEK